jgi:hypothetical protein
VLGAPDGHGLHGVDVEAAQGLVVQREDPARLPEQLLPVDGEP